MNVIKCKICGKEEDVDHWTNAAEMTHHQMCFKCNFWREKMELDSKRDKHTWAVINGEHYYLEPHTDGYFKGFGGRKFRIRFNDGFETVCDNLWYQGEVPEGYWREQFPDNATFLPEQKWHDIGGEKYLMESSTIALMSGDTIDESDLEHIF